MRMTGQQERRWRRRQDVWYWYALGIAFSLAGVAQIGLAVARNTGGGYVIVGVAYLLISAGWLAVGGYKRRREPSDARGG